MMQLIRTLFFPLYSLIYSCVFFCIKVYAHFNADMKKHLEDRLRIRSYNVDQNVDPNSKRALFFVSSAGEYEQALPLMERLEKNSEDSYECFIIFFSPSGIRFAQKRKETRPMFLSPPDFKSYWEEFFLRLKPQITFVIRHELWPNFTRTASKHSSLYLANASLTSDTTANRFYLRLVSPFFRKIFTVTLYDQNVLRYLLRDTNVLLSGDTKYDRVLDRKQGNQAEISNTKDLFQSVFAGKKFLVIGSAWPKDVEMVLDSYLTLDDSERNSWRVVIAPHDLSPNMLELIKNLVSERGLSLALYDQIETGAPRDEPVVLVDKLGILFELYGIAAAAFVGGALHHKIHNVLEPAVYGCHIAHGPRFHNQKESKWLAEKGYSKVVTSPVELTKWWQHLPSQHNEMMLKALHALMGASDQVVKTL